jgi:hypothetical protein
VPSESPHEPILPCLLLFVHYVLLLLAFFIIRAVPAGSPLNIDLYCDNTIISLVIYNPVELSYCSNTKETLKKPVNDNWDNHKDWDNNEGWNHVDNWTPGLGNQPQLNTRVD